jgi:S1-C subfamily serine protease
MLKVWRHSLTQRLVPLLLLGASAFGPSRAGAQGTGGDGAALVERMQKATVQVLCEGSWGSGFAVGTARTIVTNAHVVADCTNLRVRASDGQIATARLMVTDDVKDVAVLEVDGTLNVSPVTLRSDGVVKVGEEVFALGFPGNAQKADDIDRQKQNPLARVTRGPVSRAAFPAENGERFLLDHSAGIYPGNSGGPLFDACGRVVAVNSFIAADVEGDNVKQFYGDVGFAVGARTIAAVLAKTGQTPTLESGGCTVPFNTIVGATVASVKGVGGDAQAAAARLQASYSKFQKQYDARWDSLQAIVAQGDSAETARAKKAEVLISGFVNGVQAQLNSNIAGVNTRIDDIDQKVEDLVREEKQWRKILLAVLAVLALVVGGVVWKQRAQGDDLKELYGKLEKHERKLQELGEGAIQKLTAEDAKGGRDAREAVEILMATPGYTAGTMPEALRTQVARTVSDRSGAPATRPARTEMDHSGAPATQPARTQTDGLVVTLTVRDGREAAPSSLTLPIGCTAYIGRDKRTMQTVADRFALTPELILLSSDDRLSRCHLSISNEGDGVRVTDLSLNGTFSNGPLADIRRSNRPLSEARRNRPEVLELGDSVKLSGPATFSLARPDSGYTIDVRVSAVRASAHHNN